ncbi:MAG: hypothetical protein WC532_01105 [Candidatus Omnitrophota bacterium]
MTSAFFKKSIAISLLGHLTAFSLFSVSSGIRPIPADYGKMVFRGCVLTGFDFNRPVISRSAASRLNLKRLTDKAGTEGLKAEIKPTDAYLGGDIKPAVFAPGALEKQPFIPVFSLPSALNKQRTAVMFYPRLPNYFSLYFKDRQVVHMELMFKVSSGRQGNPISVKRKISSGNLEADLLCMRYINHYLFVQQKTFGSGTWQNVKIELSTASGK